MNQLIVKNLSKHFGQNHAVNNLTFSATEGQAYCLLGGNGAGKSTTLSLLLGFLKADQGSFKFGSYDLWEDRDLVRKHIFYLPELVSLYPEFTAVENLQYFCALSNLSKSFSQIKQALTDVGLNEVSHLEQVKSYSKGMRQKVALAFAKLKQAKLLLLDEPTSGLDPIAIKESVALINSLKKDGACIIMVSHDLKCTYLLADNIGILQSGVLKKQIANNNITLDQLEEYYFNSIN